MAERRHHRFVWWAGLGIVLVLATALWLHDLGSESLSLDEGVSWARTLAGPTEIVADSAVRDTHPPLYYLVVDAWTAVAGHSAWALRFPSLVFSVATTPVVYALGRDLFDRRAGLLGGLLVGLVEFQITYGQEARMYAMVGFLATTAALAHTDERTLPVLADDREYSRAGKWTEFPQITIERWQRSQGGG